MKIAVYSGSFNPIHNGHIAIARAALSEGYDEVWMLVSPQNPHKTEEELLPFEERMKMVQLCLANEKRIKVSDCENKLPRPSYTIHTLEYLREQYPQHQFRLLIGSDNLQKFQLWKDYQKIIDSFGLIVYPRASGTSLPLANQPNIQLIKAPLLNISSTEIKKLLSENHSIHGLVSTEVEKYLLQKIKFNRFET
ncbi:MAG: nicotinate (nicotinamide) nucleotide adenylyltransferase [Prolixibacteraceae bacterium]